MIRGKKLHLPPNPSNAVSIGSAVVAGDRKNEAATDRYDGAEPRTPGALGAVARDHRVERLQQRLTMLARTLGKDFRLRLEPGSWWAYHFESNKITYPVEQMLKSSDDANLGVICHELAHRLYSRIPPGDQIDNPAFHFLWNSIEDIRINKLISQRYAGVPAMMRELYRSFTDIEARSRQLQELAEQGRDVPRTKQFGLGAIYEWASDGAVDPLVTDPLVLQALEEARPAIERATRLPPEVDLRFDDLTPEEVELEAAASYRVIRDELWPIYQRLLEADVEEPKDGDVGGEATAAKKKALADELSAAARELGGQIQELEEKGDRGSDGIAPDARSSERPPALDYDGDREIDLDELLKSYEAKLRNRPPPAPLNSYQATKKKYRREIQQLVEELGNAFQRNEMPELIGHFKGGIYDLRKGIQSELRRRATGKADPKVFLKREDPKQRSVEIVFCIDCSGSMRNGPGSNMESAREAFVVFMEALGELGVGHGVLMYNAQVTVLKPLEEEKDERQRAELFEKLVGGGDNNDSGALLGAKEMLERGSAETKIVIFLSDGGAVANHKQCVDRVEAETNIKVIGLGIGAGCQQVPAVYKHHLCVDDTAKLPRRLGALLMDELLGA